MAKPISSFFESLGFPLRNVRWSWGAKAGGTVVFRSWSDEFAVRERTVLVLREPDARQHTESFGLDERLTQLEQLWAGGLAGYTVIANVKDPAAQPREIKDFRDDVVFPLVRLLPQDDGSIRAEVGTPVQVMALREHLETHRTLSGDGPFPALDARTGLSTDSYQLKLPAMRAWLIDRAQAKSPVLYMDVMDRFGIRFYGLRAAMGTLGKAAVAAGEPVITALIVNKETLRCSQGFFDEFGILDDEAERQRLYDYWGGQQPAPAQVSGPAAEAASSPTAHEADEDFQHRLIRFTRAPVRPEQAPFRQAVFRRFDGRCVVTGCTVPEALEAAHLLGRDWRQGHNQASDGLLLRRDIHALYDRGLVKISSEMLVDVDPAVSPEYGQYVSKPPPAESV
jgi:hypothetical protein